MFPARTCLRLNRRARVGRPCTGCRGLVLHLAHSTLQGTTHTKSGEREAPLIQGHDLRLGHNAGVRSTEWLGTFSFVSRSSGSGRGSVVGWNQNFPIRATLRNATCKPVLLGGCLLKLTRTLSHALTNTGKAQRTQHLLNLIHGA